MILVQLAIAFSNIKELNYLYGILKSEKVLKELPSDCDCLLIQLYYNGTINIIYTDKKRWHSLTAIHLTIEQYTQLRLNLDLGLIPFDYEAIRDRGMK